MNNDALIKLQRAFSDRAITRQELESFEKEHGVVVKEDWLEYDETGQCYFLSPEVLELIKSDDDIWEREPLESLAKSNNLTAYKHEGFWQPMDTLRDKNYLIPKICLAAINAHKYKIKTTFYNVLVAREWNWCEEQCDLLMKFISKTSRFMEKKY